MNQGLVAVLGALVPLLMAVGTYLGMRLQRSGRIRSSEATDLWKESAAIRSDLREEIRLLRDESAELRSRNDSLERRIDALQNERNILLGKVELLEQRITLALVPAASLRDMEAERDRMLTEMASLQSQIRDLVRQAREQGGAA